MKASYIISFVLGVFLAKSISEKQWAYLVIDLIGMIALFLKIADVIK